MTVTIRPARTADVPLIRELVDHYAADGTLLSKATVTLYEDIQEFTVADVDDEPVGVGALHVMWSDLAEVRTLAVRPSHLGLGVGGLILDELVKRARLLGVDRVFCLTHEVDFFGARGFAKMLDDGVTTQVFAELMLSEDEGVAEFLDLERVKPNTLGNTRMILRL